MKKKVFLALFIMLLTVSVTAIAATNITLIVNGKQVTTASPKVENGTTYVPLRAVSETLGATVNWNQKTKTVSISQADQVSLIGTWEGVYTASQGETKATLEFSKDTVAIKFGPTETNTKVPTGEIVALYEYDTVTKGIKIEGVKWVTQPSNYSFVDFNGAISGNRMTGAVISTSNDYIGDFSFVKK
ncbi:copper amine oxidase N-terminal domain-containing protein [Ureibacillus sp. GCM10028918]|uniref:copper amine oxidase N-terminal domain-containing protein n=1 Tax=Ureibacillus sp. GCM10028918 TaxID=3273429 RepID=UPI00362332E3